MRTMATTISRGILGPVFVAKGAQAVTLTERFEQDYPLDAGGRLELRNVSGAVTLEAWDRNEVRVEAQKKVRGVSEEAVRKAMEQTRIVVAKTAEGLRIATRLPTRPGEGGGVFVRRTVPQVSIAVEYRVWVPQGARLDIGSVNGALTLTGTRGRARLETTNGAISVTEVSGDLRLETTNGGIDVRLTGAPRDGRLSLSTTNGGVKIQLPRGAGATVDAASLNGRLSSDFQVTGVRKGRRRVAGAINGGGGMVRVRTTNGSIRIVEG